MVTALEKPSLRAVAAPISVDQYHQLGEAGIIRENTELLFGVIVEKMSKSPLHTWVVERLAELLQVIARERDEHIVRQEQPLTFSDSEPEPDIAFVRGDSQDFRHAHPSHAELVIEVAISSTGVDLEKAEAYASAEIQEYWLIEPKAGQISVFSEPLDGKYAKHERFQSDDLVSSHQVSSFQLRLSEIL